MRASESGIPRTRNERHKGLALGYVPTPGSARARYMDAAQRVIEVQPRPRSTRFIAYRTAGALGVDHKQLDAIEDAVVMLRRSGRVSLNAVRDHRSTWLTPWTPSAAVAAEEQHARLRTLRLDRQEGQPHRVVLLIEAAGMLDTLHEVADAYGVPLVSGSGSVPLSVTARLAADAIEWYTDDDIPTRVLVWTDLDLMGLRNIFVPAALDIEAFAAQAGAPDAVTVHRIGATPEQALAHIPRNLLQPPPNPRPAWWPCDFSLPTSEALEDVLPDLVRAEFDRYLPADEQRRAIVAAESDERRAAAAELARLLAEDEEPTD